MLLAIFFACQNTQAPLEEPPVEEVLVKPENPNSDAADLLQPEPASLAALEMNVDPSDTESVPTENPLQEGLAEDSVLDGIEALEIENSPKVDEEPNIDAGSPPLLASDGETKNTTQNTDQTEGNGAQDIVDAAETVESEQAETITPLEVELPEGGNPGTDDKPEGKAGEEGEAGEAGEGEEAGEAGEAGEVSTNDTATPESLILTQPAIYATTYRFHSSNSQLVVQVFKEPNTVGASMSHDHVILARTWTGSIRWHSEDPNQCVFEFRVPVNALDPDPPKLRAKYGLEGSLTQSQREDIKENMLSSDQLDAEKYPNITFQAFSCERKLESFIIKGLLNIRGVERSVRFQMDIVLNEGFHAKGSFFVHHQDFDFEPYSALLGAIQNQEDIKISFDLHSLQPTP